MPSSTSAARFITIALLAGCSAFGAYATLGTSSRNGLFEALSKAAGSEVKAKSKHFPGGPTPYKLTYTGVTAIDDTLVVLNAFFSVILSDANSQDVSWVLRYLSTQFLAGWLLVYVEGLRRGNKGRIVSWTGTFGAIFQNITYTVTIPVYLIIHLLTSPTSTPGLTEDIVSMTGQDLFILPFAVIGAYVVPTIMMALPSPRLVAPASHYNWLSLWQAFPVAQSLYHGIYKRITGPINFKQNASEQMDDLYRSLAALSFVPHSTLLALAATPAHLVPDSVLAFLPGITRKSIENFDLIKAFVPHMPWSSPVATGLGAKVIKAQGLTELVKMFLQWDVYVGGAAILIWSVFVYSVARPEKSLVTSVLPRVLVWTALGGPVGAATMVLWERDVAVRQRASGSKSPAAIEK